MPDLSRLSYLDVVLVAAVSWTLYKLGETLRRRMKTTRLNGPPRASWIFGASEEVIQGDASAMFEQWAKEYGPVYQIPTQLGGCRTVLTDPKAIAHFYAKETFVYMRPKFGQIFIETLVMFLWFCLKRHTF